MTHFVIRNTSRLMAAALLLAMNFQPMRAASAEETEGLKLSEPQLFRGKRLMEALKTRKSSREFSPKELSHDTMSNLLWAAFGVNRSDSGKRTAPSTANWQEIEIYAAMKSGLYLYKPKKNTLVRVSAEDIREFTGQQAFTQAAAVNLIYVADLSRMVGSDREKDFYSAVDAGLISQNVYLFCASEGLATVVLGWVEKERLARLMGLRKDQRVILTQPVGYSK
ncbi:SagB/ThcOx family dehydrogenase [Candidatus Omnitrophota bacterium]